MESHIKFLGVLYIVYHSIGLILAWLVWGFLSGIGLLSGDPAAAGVLTLVGTIVATLLFAMSAPGVLGGVGILKGWWWARYLVLILGFVNLIHIPLGTVLGIYTFWVLLQDETVAFFEADRDSGTRPFEPAA